MTDSLVSTEQRHKKEKKDLQSRIQSLKKSVGKGDKKKKKEILDEILRLETELETRHLLELNVSQGENVHKNDEDMSHDLGENRDVRGTKISKAQKRRDKKAAEEKARVEMISKQEEENINGPRNLEIQSIRKLLCERGLMLHIIPSNGDCLYSAISHQLNLICKDEKSPDELRKLTSEHIRNNKNNYLPFLSNNVTGELLTDNEFQEYCHKIENTKCWGGQVELQAMSEILKCPIHIIQSAPPHIITQGDRLQGEALTVAYHRHMYGLGEHYNSTKPVLQSTNPDFVISS